jgi:hypothetical protein
MKAFLPKARALRRVTPEWLPCPADLTTTAPRRGT